MKWALYISFLFLAPGSYSQNYAPKKYYLIDSLDLAELSEGDIGILQSSLKRYHVAKSDTARINALSGICEEMMHADWMKYQFYQHDLIKKALKKNPSQDVEKVLNESLSVSLNNIGYIYKQKGKIETALDYYNRALKMQKKVGDKSRMAQTLNNMGVIQQNQGKISSALESYYHALKLQEELNDSLGIASSYFNIGSLHYRLEDYDMALSYYQKALKVYKGLGSKKGISNVYNNMGVLYKEKGDFTSALNFYKKCIKLKKEIGETPGLIDSYINIGTMYSLLGDNKSAYDNYDQARLLSAETENANGLTTAYNHIAELKYEAGEIMGEDGSYAYAQKSLNIAQEIGFPEKIRDASELLYRIFNKQGKYAESLEMHELYIQMKDSISNIENQRATSRRQAQYEYETQKALDDKEHEKLLAIEVEEKEKQKILVYAASTGLLFLIVFLAYVFNRLKVTRRQKRTIEEQKKEVDKAYVDLNVEKEKSEELLLNILPEEVAEELKEKGAADARSIENVTVLFTDFKGFTALSEQLSAKALVNEINTCFSAFDRIMEKYNVEKIKTIGDAYMAAGGLPVPNETHALDVIHAALEIQAFMLSLAEEKKAKNEPYFEIRIGVHTGPVVAGIVGVKKFQYDIWGDTVNTASRMESSGGVGKVNISAATYELIKDNTAFTFESRGDIEAKGKGKLQMYFVERA